ncbi:MAG TPA: type II secretion system protein GspJ [Candidatus Limnocylindrales bacterium]|jgi:type II secretion system protein J|nr:type II secretion system protein GspJ [Candidatus Limnocylindrales bacterium]
MKLAQIIVAQMAPVARASSASCRRVSPVEPRHRRAGRHGELAGEDAHGTGFTLIEVILAIGIFAIVLVAMNTAFFAALRLRQKTSDAVESSRPLTHGLALLRHDLQNAVAPGGVLKGDFRSGGAGGGPGSRSSSTTGKGAVVNTLGSQNPGLDFFTSTGALSDDSPWGDIQEVNYQLMDPLDPARSYGKDLVRTINRNLLATATQATEVQRLAGNIENLDFSYFDGTQWRDTWDTTAGDTGLPRAVRVSVQLASSEGPSRGITQPLQMVVLLDSMSVTNQ